MKYVHIIAAFFAGVAFGTSAMLMVATSNTKKLTNSAAQSKQTYENTINELNQQAAKDAGKIEGLQIIVDACQSAYLQGTVLYDTNGSAIVRVPLFRGMFDLSVAPSSPTAKPRWIIPAKIKPMVIGNARGVSYSYLDPKTGSVSGPFTPDVAP